MEDTEFTRVPDIELKFQLDHYYSTIAKVTTPGVFREFRETANKVLREIIRTNQRFRGEIVEVGSLASQDAVVFLDECDMLLPIDIDHVDGNIEATSDGEFVKFKLTKSAQPVWNDYTNESGYLDPQLFSNKFFELTKESLRSMKVNDDVYKLDGKGTVAATICFEYKTFDFSVDLVPAVRCSTWYLPEKPKWFYDNRKCNWPPKEVLETILARGTELVAKPSYPDNGSWRLSFSHAETDLLESAKANLTTFARVLVILKTVRKLFLSPKDHYTTPIFKSYHVKILLLNETMEFFDDESWAEQNLALRFKSVLERLRRCTETGYLPHLFIPSVNLFQRACRKFILQHKLFTDTLLFFKTRTPLQKTDFFPESK